MKKELLEEVCMAIAEGKSIHKSLGGATDKLVIEKSLPYLCLYRYLGDPDPQILDIIQTQASYAICYDKKELKTLITCISQTISEAMNTFMLLEIWPGKINKFKVYCPEGKAPATLDSLVENLQTFEKIEGAEVEVVSQEPSPLRLKPIFTLAEAIEIGCLPIGIQIPPAYRDEKGALYPVFFRGFKAHMSETIKKAAFEFIRVQTSRSFDHHLMLGKTTIDDAAKQVDECFAEISAGMNFLMLVSPVNQNSAWQKFKQDKFKELPQFNYRMITIDPEKVKKELYEVPLDEVEDPTLSFILRDKRKELERKLSMLEERETANFRYLGQAIYGVPDHGMLSLAEDILDKVKPGKSGSDKMDCFEFAKEVKQELSYYQERFPDIPLEVEIREDVGSLMVSKSKLLVSRGMSINPKRAKALIQHEIGTHMLTYCNGLAQPLRQMAHGFARYDQLQEGLGVLSEYLAGGFNANRLRLLASRVKAVGCMVSGADFIETFNLLKEECGLSEQLSFKVTLRVYRGGGLTKDAIYLKGLVELLQFVRDGGNLEILFTGKFNLEHVPVIEELLRRDILREPVLPNHYGEEAFQKQLNTIKTSTTPVELLNK